MINLNHSKVHGLEFVTGSGWAKISACFNIGGHDHSVTYKVSNCSITECYDPFLPVTLLPAMKFGAQLHFQGGLSRRLMQSVPTIQDIYNKWYHNTCRIQFTAGNEEIRSGVGNEIGCFFSGGVDSFYTFLKNRKEITTLILVHGFDIKLDNVAIRNEVSRQINKIAKVFGKDVVEVETSIRDFSDKYVDWTDYFGSGLASVALLLQNKFAKIYVPSSESYAFLNPCGSHPLLDPLWSTESLAIVHDGCEFSRNEKVAYIAGEPIVKETLRVCWENRNNSYNCCVCEKCIRTMISLHALGILNEFRVFPKELDSSLVKEMRITHELVFAQVEENYNLLKNKCNEHIVSALEYPIKRYKAAMISKIVADDINTVIESIGYEKTIEFCLAHNLKNSIFSIIKYWLKCIDNVIFGGYLKRIIRRVL